MTYKRLLIILSALIFGVQSYASLSGFIPSEPKGGTITGRIIDGSTNKPMEYVNIALFRSADSSMVTGVVTSEAGEFKIEKVPHGSYYIRLTFIGFDKKFMNNIALTPEKQVQELGDITLEASSAQLETATIVGEKAKIEYQIDKRVINVDQSVVSKGGSAVNVLENTPSIQVDPQGNVTLRGSSDYVVLVDGKPSILKGSDALKQINAASIKQIEVITNPSARYDADGQAGIINVIRKKDQLQGLSGTINTSIGTSDKYTANGIVNYRKGKINLFAGIDFAKNIYRNDITLHNISYLSEGNLSLNEFAGQYYHNDNLSGKAGIDFDLNTKNSFTFSGTYGEQGYDQGTEANINTHYTPSTGDVYNLSSNTVDVNGKVPDLTLDYTHKFGENHSLIVSGSYTAWDGVDNNTLTDKMADENYSELGTKSALNFVKDNFNYRYRVNVDYKQALKKGTLETGVQYRYEYRYDDLTFKNLDVESNTWIPNEFYSYKLDYKNDIYSGYATYSDKLWGIGYMIGLRSEYFTRHITFDNDSSAYNFNKFMLYPSLHFSKEINQMHQFQLSYSRRINRPAPWILNKQPGFIDPYNTFMGSPEIEPEYTDAYEFNYRLMYKIITVSAQTYYRNTSNSFSTLRNLQEDGVMIHQMINADKQRSYGIELGLDFNLNKWWQVSSGGNIYHYSIESDINNQQSSNDAYSWDARLISNFSLKWGSRLQAIGYFRGAGIDAQGNTTGFYTVNLAVNQPLMKGKLNVGITAQNIFNSIRFDYTVKSARFDNSYLIKAEGAVLMITANYSFNNFQNKQRGRTDDTDFKGGGMF